MPTKAEDMRAIRDAAIAAQQDYAGGVAILLPVIYEACEGQAELGLSQVEFDLKLHRTSSTSPFVDLLVSALTAEGFSVTPHELGVFRISW